MRIALLNEDEDEVWSGEATCSNNEGHTVDMEKRFAPGVYTLSFIGGDVSELDYETWFVIGSCAALNEKLEEDSVTVIGGATNDSTLSISITPETVQGGAALPLYGLSSAGGALRLHIVPIQYQQQHIMGASDLATVSVASSPAKQWFGYPYEATTPISVTGTIASLFDWTNGATIADYIDGSGDVTIGLSYRYNGSWEELNVKAMISGDTTTTGQVAFATVNATVTTASNQIAVANPLPASTVSDEGKILTVNSSGAPAWGMLGSVTSIQQVSALPATPDANTLYLIPEA